LQRSWVRRRSETGVLTTTIAAALLATVAYAVITGAGAVLWKRTHSLAAAMVALGFALVLLDQIVALVEYLELRSLLRGHAADTLFIVHHHLFLHYVADLGLWIAAVGLAWHSARVPGR